MYKQSGGNRGTKQISSPEDEWEDEPQDSPHPIHSPPGQIYHQSQSHNHNHPASMSRSDPSYNQHPAPNRFPPPPPQGYNLSSLPHQGQCQGQGHHRSQHGHTHTTGPAYPEGDEHAEPEDVLVWSTPSKSQGHGHGHGHPGQGQVAASQSQSHHSRPPPPPQQVTNFPRSHSDTEDSRQSLRKSRSIKSLGLDIKSSQNETPSNGNFISEEYENHMVAVTKQLEQIKSTQDSILSELSDDMSNLQFENVQLKNTNEHLTMQNSHLLQVISDLSNEVEHMRGVFRVRGWPIKEIQVDEKNKVAPGPESEIEKKIQEPEVVRKLDEEQEKRRQRRSSSSSRRHSGATGAASPAKFETIPLTESQEKVKGPGDDQVDAMSRRSRNSTSSGKRRKSAPKPPGLATTSSDSFGGRRGRGSSSSTKISKGKTPSGRIDVDGRGFGEKQPGCFKNLFKRKNKKRRSTSSSDNFVR